MRIKHRGLDTVKEAVLAEAQKHSSSPWSNYKVNHCRVVARICLSHSFPYQDIGAYGGGGYKGTQEEIWVWLLYDVFFELIQLNALRLAV